MTEPQTKKTKVSALDQLKAFTTIVADTGDFEGMYRNVLRLTIFGGKCLAPPRELFDGWP